MENKVYKISKLIALLSLGLTVFLASCEREFSDDVEFATFPPNGDVFIDNFSPGLDFFPFVGDGADPQAFSVVNDMVFSGTSAMRFDVPNFGDGFVGAAFNTTANRDLSEFDALTFYAKASQGATINEIGFGVNAANGNRFQAAVSGLEISTRWEKYVIPIPDASRLIDETGLLFLSEGASFEGDEGGYIFWLDEVRFETLGTIGQPRPAIFSGQDLTEQAFTGSTLNVTGLTFTANLESGENQTVIAAPSYFNFESSNTDVAIVNELGEISVIGAGTTQITAILNGVLAEGSLEITSTGGLPFAPTPTVPEANVRSIFSDAYTNATASNFTPNFGGSTTETSIVSNNGDNILTYTNNNFTGIIFENTVDASSLGFLHVDVFVQDGTSSVDIQIRDIGPDQTLETDVNTGLPIGDDADFRFTLNGLTQGQWTSFDIPLSGDLVNQRDNLGALILVGGPNFILDNIYFFTN
ncbi:glycosyl hydrolase family 16 [Flavobacteriaceae bacterium R38]|nr:glycosyl hydrolase family 16 [Flavobacteriaceae bacterium R38]